MRALLRDSEIVHLLVRSPLVMACGLVALAILAGAALAPWIAPTDPYDLASFFRSR